MQWIRQNKETSGNIFFTFCAILYLKLYKMTQLYNFKNHSHMAELEKSAQKLTA